MRMVRTAGVAAGLAALLLGAGTAQAQAARDDEGAIKYRQHLMGAIGGDMAALSDLVKYGLPLDRAPVHAASLHSHSQLVAGAFERRSAEGPTDAKPEIWEKPAEFEQSVQAFVEATASFEKTVGTLPESDGRAALGAALKELGKSCGKCHDSFRKPKEESYHRHAQD